MIAVEVFRWIAFWLALSGAFVFVWCVFVFVCVCVARFRRRRGEYLAGPESRGRLPHSSVLTGGEKRRRDLRAREDHR